MPGHVGWLCLGLKFEAQPSPNSCMLSAAMDHRKTTLERAFELAKSGVYANFGEVRTKIKNEGYDVRQMIGGLSLRKQINQIIQSARANADCGVGSSEARARSPEGVERAPVGERPSAAGEPRAGDTRRDT